VFEGFLLKLNPEYIGGFDNVCLTKRSINAFKSNKLIEDFIELFKKLK